VIDRDGHSMYPPIWHLEGRRPAITSALARSSLTLDLDLRSMAQLGIHSARGNAELYRYGQAAGQQTLTLSKRLVQRSGLHGGHA
jgi:hypothetical protein